MKSKFQIVLVLAGLVLGFCGCGDNFGFQGGTVVSLDANIAGIEPTSGAIGSIVQIDIDNLGGDDQVLFDGVPVSLTEVEGSASASFAAIALETEKTSISTGTEDSAADGEGQAGSKRYSFKVPNVGLGVMDVYVSRGSQKSNAVNFEVISPASGGTNNPPPDDGEGDDDGDDGDNGGGTTPPPDAKASASLDMCYCRYLNDDKKDYIPPDKECGDGVTICGKDNCGALVVSWSVSNVKSAYVSMNLADVQPFIENITSPIGYMDFIGDPDVPHVGTKASSLDTLKTALLDDPLKDFEDLSASLVSSINSDDMGLPFSYCRLYTKDSPGTLAQDKAGRCFDKDMDGLSAADKGTINIFLPLHSGEKDKSGTWLVETLKDNGLSSFKLYYKEWVSSKNKGKSIGVKNKSFNVPGIQD